MIFSVVPYSGDYGLEHISQSVHPVAELQAALTQALHISWITQATNLFSSICIITSFLANSISLTDFIADGLGKKKNWLVYFVAYIPATLAVIFYQKAFLLGLSIAGTVAVIQLLILPGLIVWFLRYVNKKNSLSYSVVGGKALLAFLILISIVLFILTIVG